MKLREILEDMGHLAHFALDNRTVWYPPGSRHALGYFFRLAFNLKAVISQLKNSYTPITELRSAVIWTKGVSIFTPDYSVELLPSNPWIHQPFEGYDSLRPAQLIEKWSV